MHGVANLEHRLHFLTDKNAQLTRDNAALEERLKRLEDSSSKVQRGSELEKQHARSLAVAKRTIQER